MSKDFKKEIKLNCFEKNIEDILLSKITETTTKEEFLTMIREYIPEYSFCSECGNELESGDDGVYTTWGTCQECIEKGDNDD